jgi:hypothetical protein
MATCVACRLLSGKRYNRRVALTVLSVLTADFTKTVKCNCCAFDAKEYPTRINTRQVNFKFTYEIGCISGDTVIVK